MSNSQLQKMFRLVFSVLAVFLQSMLTVYMLAFAFQFELCIILMTEETILIISLEEAIIHSVLLEAWELQFLIKAFGKYHLLLHDARGILKYGLYTYTAVITAIAITDFVL